MTSKMRNVNIYLSDSEDIDKIEFHKSSDDTQYTYKLHSSVARDFVDIFNPDVMFKEMKVFAKRICKKNKFTSNMYLNITVYDVLSDSRDYFYADTYKFVYSHRTKSLSVEVYDKIAKSVYAKKERFVTKEVIK